MNWNIEVLLFAIFLDLLIGDPKSRFHPVALIGKLIKHWELFLYQKARTPFKQRIAGMILVLSNILPVYFGICFLLKEAKSSYISIIVGGILLWGTISIYSLDQAAREILHFLLDKNYNKAREHLGLIVSRDTAHLDEKEIVRASVETVAENINDGIIAPLFYFFIGGIPLAWVYRVINILDAMVGYKDEKYSYFGWFAAKLDDLVNLIPARLTACLLIGSAFCYRLNWRRGIKVVWRDSRKHPSPNSGYPEAAVAGVLNIQLGGTNYYQKRPSLRPYLGDPATPLEPFHIKATLHLMYGALVISLVMILMIAYLIS